MIDVSFKGVSFSAPEQVIFSEGDAVVVVNDDLAMRASFHPVCRHCEQVVEFNYAYGERSGGRCCCGWWADEIEFEADGDFYRWRYVAWDADEKRHRYEEALSALRKAYGVTTS